MMGEKQKIVEKLVEEESEILKKVLKKFNRRRISDLNEPEVKGLLAMYKRVSRNYTAEKINSQKNKRVRMISEERKVKAPCITGELPGKRNESDLPVKCTLKSQNGIIGRIQGRKLLSPEGKQTDEIYPREGMYGVYYRFEKHRDTILTKSRNGCWLLKEKKNGKYRVVGHVSTKEEKVEK